MLSSRLKNVIHNMPDVTQCDVFVTDLCAISSGPSSWWWHFWRTRLVPVLNLACCTDCAVGLSVVRHSPSRRVPEFYVEVGHDRFIRIFRHSNRYSWYGAAKLYLHSISSPPPLKIRRSEGVKTHFKPDLIFATRGLLTFVWYYRLVNWNCK